MHIRPVFLLTLLILLALACNATSSPSITPTPTAPEISAGIVTSVGAIEGVTTVRVADVLPFDEGYIIFLEVDVQRGSNTMATASLVRVATETVTGAADMEFSVVLWDRIARATNYTWDADNSQWLTTNLTNNPG